MFKRTPFTYEEVAVELGLNVNELKEKFVRTINIEDSHGFRLFARSKHVFSEAARGFVEIYL